MLSLSNFCFLGLAVASLWIIHTDITVCRISNNALLLILGILTVRPMPCYITSLLIMIGVIGLLIFLRHVFPTRSFILGYGDMKLMCVLSLGFSPTYIPLFLIISGVGGMITWGLYPSSRPCAPFPLGPSYILAFWATQLEFFSFFRL